MDLIPRSTATTVATGSVPLAGPRRGWTVYGSATVTSRARSAPLITGAAVTTSSRSCSTRRRPDSSTSPSPEKMPARIGVLLVHPGVPDVRGRHHHDLPVVRGVGEGLLIPGHPGVEDDLADRAPSGPEHPAGEGPAVLEHQDGCLPVHRWSSLVCAITARTASIRPARSASCRGSRPVSTTVSPACQPISTRRARPTAVPAIPAAKVTCRTAEAGRYRSALPVRRTSTPASSTSTAAGDRTPRPCTARRSSGRPARVLDRYVASTGPNRTGPRSAGTSGRLGSADPDHRARRDHPRRIAISATTVIRTRTPMPSPVRVTGPLPHRRASPGGCPGLSDDPAGRLPPPDR